ncbi:hypothetical protein GCM10023091_13860 [Ravibacter arvi]|uniref:Methyltransferase family protein n=1 Tax=Ravibacter arvi TaxID=2051041 RepID=A0ABP8LUS4_9BACT
MSVVVSNIKFHNNQQLDYFGHHIKKTMIPVFSPYVQRHIQEIVSFAGIQRKDQVIDIACGMGKYTLNLLRQGFQVEGLDLSPFLLQQLLVYNDNRYQVKLHAADVLDAPEELNEKFDVVMGFMALHHFHNLHACFQAMYRIAKPGGKVVFLEPNAFNPLYYAQIFFTPGMSWEGDKGVANMTKSKLFEAMQFSGWKNLKIKRFGFYPPFVANTSFGQATEKYLERIPGINPFLPFQIVMGEKV